MSSRQRTLERQMLRQQVERDNAKERAKMIKKRKTPTDPLGINRNYDLFLAAWYKKHYSKKRVIDTNDNITTVNKKPNLSKSKRHNKGIKGLLSRLKSNKKINFSKS